MHTAFETQFEELRTSLSQGGIDALFGKLAAQLTEEKRYSELFDARLMEARYRLGLPVILTKSIDELPAAQQADIDEALVKTCREVGGLLLADGKIGEAWHYLRHAGEKKLVAAALEKWEPVEEQVDEMVNIAVHEGVSPRRGFQLVLKSFGTCSAVTMFDQTSGNFARDERSNVAGLMVRHLHDELSVSLHAEIKRQEGNLPTEKTLLELVADRDWLFQGDSYHIDTSHLSMTVRFARWVTNPDELKLALDLTEYGRRLSPQFQYEGEAPFKDQYADHAKFFEAQLGKNVDQNLAFFRDKAAAADDGIDGTFPAETYIALLVRLGRTSEALAASVEYLPAGAVTSGLAPTLLELGKLSGDYAQLQQVCQEQQDRVNFVAGLVEELAGRK
jgi:hypothetical protein